MSEWEEFCESKGMNAGSQEDYEHWLDSLDAPKAKRPEEPRLITELESDLTLDELVVLVRRKTLGDHSAEFHFIPWGWDLPGGIEIDESAIHGIDYASEKLHLYAVKIQENNEVYVSLKMLMDALRVTLIPIEISNSVLAWSTDFQCLHSDNYKHISASSDIPTRSEMTAEYRKKLTALLEKMKITEHGFKPLIINRRELDLLGSGQWLSSVNLSDIDINAITNYVLAYFNTRGQPKYIPLDDILYITSKIPTRIGTVVLENGAFRRAGDNAAQLMIGALKVITYKRGICFYPCYFFLKEGGTVFEPAFKKVSESELGPLPLDRVYVTDGPHPLGPCTYVTTMSHVEDMRGRKSFFDNNCNVIAF